MSDGQVAKGGKGFGQRHDVGGLGSGEWMLIGTSLTWTAYTLASRRYAQRLSPLALAFGGCLCGWAMLTAAALVDGSLFELGRLSWQGASSIAFLGLFGTAIAPGECRRSRLDTRDG